MTVGHENFVVRAPHKLYSHETKLESKRSSGNVKAIIIIFFYVYYLKLWKVFGRCKWMKWWAPVLFCIYFICAYAIPAAKGVNHMDILRHFINKNYGADTTALSNQILWKNHKIIRIQRTNLNIVSVPLFHCSWDYAHRTGDSAKNFLLDEAQNFVRVTVCEEVELVWKQPWGVCKNAMCLSGSCHNRTYAFFADNVVLE